MSTFRINLKPVVAAAALAVGISAPLAAQEAGLDELFARLKTADAVDAARIDREIGMAWSQSGSPAMDLLLKRGRKALEAEDYAAAIEHFTALTDHAPDFAEGWNGLAQGLALTGRLGPAVEALEQALLLNPRQYGGDLRPRHGLRAGRPAGLAYDAYRLVLDLYPQHEEAQQSEAARAG
ncbi:MAG: tetratricopeptide repeat protein [Paracoccaceae bacterium]